jgi:hypothetical protein
VDGPASQSTLKISSSDGVGRGGSFVMSVPGYARLIRKFS